MTVLVTANMVRIAASASSMANASDLGRLVWMEDDDILVQVLAEHVADDEVVAVAEGLELTPAP